MEVKLAAKEKLLAEAADVKVKAEAEAYIIELKQKISEARNAANAGKLRWTTSFNLPYSQYTVNDTALNWKLDESGSPVVTEWLPAWWTKMVLDQKAGKVSSSKSSTTVISSTGIPASIDMGWTTADAKNASVWKGPDVWRAKWDQNQMDFHSRIVAGDNISATVKTVDTPTAAVVETSVDDDDMMAHPALHGKA